MSIIIFANYRDSYVIVYLITRERPRRTRLSTIGDAKFNIHWIWTFRSGGL